MGPYVTFLFLAALVAVQTAVMPYADLGPAKPLLPLLAVVAWGLLRGPTAALWWALVTGLLLDVVSPGAPGLYTVPLLCAAAVVGLSRSRLFPNNFLLPGAVAALATLVFTLVQRALLHASLPEAVPGLAWTAAALAEESLPVLVLNLLWLPIIYFPLHRLADQIGPPRMEWGR